ncbi:hypothetical protein NUACC21_34160 [Scytonema sp. NUACC21]
MVNSPSNASGNGKDSNYQPGEVYENLDPGLWAKTDAETGESELVFEPQLPEEIQPEKTDENEDGSRNPNRN